MSEAARGVRELLSSVRIFQALPASDLDVVARHSAKRIHARGDSVFNVGDEVENLWVVARGRVHVFRFTSEGRRIAIEVVVKGDLFGLRYAFSEGRARYDCAAVAKEPTVLVAVPCRVFSRHCLMVPECAREICLLCARKLASAYEMRCVNQESVAVRLAAALVSLHRDFGDIVPLTKKELSEVIDATQETTFRTLSRLQKAGSIESLRGGIRIVNLARLKSLNPN